MVKKYLKPFKVKGKPYYEEKFEHFSVIGKIIEITFDYFEGVRGVKGYGLEVSILHRDYDPMIHTESEQITNIGYIPICYPISTTYIDDIWFEAKDQINEYCKWYNYPLIMEDIDIGQMLNEFNKIWGRKCDE